LSSGGRESGIGRERGGERKGERRGGGGRAKGGTEEREVGEGIRLKWHNQV